MGYLRRGFPAGARQKDLASAHHESVFGAQPSFEAFAFLFRWFPNKNWRFHAEHYSPSHTTTSEDALGHRVTVLEQDDDVGGQLRLVSRTPQRAEWGELIRYFRVQLERLGIDVRLNTTATRELVIDMDPDGVVFAAGSEPMDPGIASDGSAQILPDWEVFDLNAAHHSRIVVLAKEDHQESPSIAEYLADRSYSIDLVTSAPVVGRAVDIAGLPPLLRRLDEKQVRAHTSSSIARVVDGTVFLDSARGQGVRRLEGVAAIVVCGLRKARTELYQQLVSSGVPVELVGDARAPRRANEAIREGHWAGRSVSKALALHG